MPDRDNPEPAPQKVLNCIRLGLASFPNFHLSPNVPHSKTLVNSPFHLVGFMPIPDPIVTALAIVSLVLIAATLVRFRIRG